MGEEKITRGIQRERERGWGSNQRRGNSSFILYFEMIQHSPARGPPPCRDDDDDDEPCSNAHTQKRDGDGRRTAPVRHQLEEKDNKKEHTFFFPISLFLKGAEEKKKRNLNVQTRAGYTHNRRKCIVHAMPLPINM